MTKQTMKKRKKNARLKRTIRKTVAALFMIMAVIVAAIPVEQLGTMQAKTQARTDVDLDKLYDAYADETDGLKDNKIGDYVSDAAKFDKKTSYGTGGNDADYQIVTLSGTTLKKLFLVDKRTEGDYSGTGVIVGYFGDGGNVVIEEEMSTGYFTINQSYMDEVVKILEKETYQASFGTSGGATVHSGLGSSQETITVPAQISTTPSYSNQRTNNGTIQAKTWDAAASQEVSKAYKYVNGLDTGLTDEAIFKSYAVTAYNSKLEEIRTYNEQITKLNEAIDKAKAEDAEGNGKNIDSAMIESWKDQISELTPKGDNAKELTVSYASGMDSDRKEAFLKDVIIKRCYRDNSSSGALDKYTLVEIDDQATSDVSLKGKYIPKWNTGGTKPTDVDDNGYITTGKIKITGIGNKAFSGITNNLTVTLSSAVEFIGNEAFMDCYNLTSVDLAYCKVVGNRAFKNCTNLTKVSFGNDTEPKKAGILGAEAFYNCQNLRTVSFPPKLSEIGRGCFAYSGLESFYVSKTVSERTLTIYPFAFYECKNLGISGNVSDYFPDMTSYTLTIGLGAFALTSGGGNIKSFAFPEGMKKIIANTVNDEFGLDKALEKAAAYLPGYDKADNSDGEIYYDYILAGRSNLETVIFPGTLVSTKIPDNTLMGCSGLKRAVFGKCSYKDSDCVDVTFDSPDLSDEPADKKKYDTDGDGETLFQDVVSTEFYIEGPGFKSNGEISSTRQCAGAAQTVNSDFIPYKYLNENGNAQMEMSYGDKNEYLAIVSVNSDGKTATLKEFKYVNSSKQSDIPNLVIPREIGGYNITALGKNCFGSNIIKKIYEVTIEDGSLTSIDEGAFSGAENLRSVTVGNSVKSIGANAFSGCKNLSYVFFTNPMKTDDWENVITIDPTAFTTTGSSTGMLTFCGEIHSGYAPYELAMSVENYAGKAGRNICYKTPAPSNLTVIRDNATGESTLVDYPHYNEIDLMNQEYVKELEASSGISGYSIMDKFEAVHGWNKTVPNADRYNQMGLMDAEKALVLNTLSVQIPEGVTSVDTKTFFKNTSGANSNELNFDYLTQGYERTDSAPYFKVTTITRKPNPNNYNDIIKLYSEDNYKESKARGYASDTVIAGLFSGYFYDDEAGKSFIGNKFTLEGIEENNNQEYVETVAAGNDLLTNVGLGSAKRLPDYAFRSCENLLSVSLGSELYDLGKAPFRGCSKLTGITGNSRFFSEKAIVYENTESNLGAGVVELQNPSGAPYRIVECLEARGTKAVLPDYIDGDVDKNLALVGSVEEEAFAYCDILTGIDLSDTKITRIPDGCFKACSNLRTVVLPESAGYIGKEAFEDTKTDVYIYNPDCQIAGSFGSDFTGKIYSYQYKDDGNTQESAVYTYCKENGLEQQFKQIGFIVTFMAEDSVIATKSVNEGGSVSAPKAPEKTGYKFAGWVWKTTDGAGNTVELTGDEALTNIKENRKLVAKYEVGNGVVSDGNAYTLKIEGGKNLSGETTVHPIYGGTSVYLEADAGTGKVFQYWTAEGTKVNADKTTEKVDCSEMLENVHSGKTLFLMPNMDVVITAHFTTVDAGGNGTGAGGTGSGNNGAGSGNNGSGTTDTETKYQLTVNYGSGTGEYKAGESVSISAYAPSSSSKVFSKWTSTNTSVGFADATSATTTIIMPQAAVTVTANYKTRTSDEDDEESEALNNRRPGSTTTTVTTGTNNATVTTTTGTVTNTTTSTTTKPSGDNITIDKNGISNTNVASTQVEGAADNFVVKVTDSSAAVTEAEEALKGKYGSLDGILYFPMDISLYDVTGRNLITDTTGLDVTVTLPIPDELIQYGGNVRAAAIENGQLRDLNVRFTTIDGIACMSFVPPHFSPYVIYVDTNNLVAGQMLDSTPKTGDPIHPKWFLAVGMACLSVLLFTTGDKNKKKKIKMA